MTHYARGAAILCQNAKFWQFIEDRERAAGNPVTVRHPDTARDWIYATLDIASRKQLDDDPAAKSRWIATVADFNGWLTGYGARQKVTPWRNDDYLALARHAPCMRCQRFKGTGKVVCAHVMGELAGYFGKGVAAKPSDFAGAYLCHDCHGVMDAYTNAEEPITRTLEWAVLILKTHDWLLRHGFVQIGKP